MLTDVAAECKDSRPSTAACATLAIALAWSHIGEASRAKDVYTQAAALDSTDETFQSVLAACKAKFDIASA